MILNRLFSYGNNAEILISKKQDFVESLAS